MVQTFPGAPVFYRFNALTASATGTVCFSCSTAPTGHAYLMNAVITFDASAVGKIWLWQGTTATAFMGPFFPTTCQSWILNLGPMGQRATAKGLDIGWCCSTSGLVTLAMNGYVV